MTITDDTAIVIRTPLAGGGWHAMYTTLGDIMDGNDPDVMERDEIVAALEVDGAYLLGGGAAPEMIITRAVPEAVYTAAEVAELAEACRGMLRALHAIRRITDGSQPVDAPGASMVAATAIERAAAAGITLPVEA